MTVTPEDVRRVASLARIGVPEERLDALVAELDGILAHMEVLSRVEPFAGEQEREGMPLAPDVPPGVRLERPLESFAPRSRDGFFLVPRLATHDEGAGPA
ncbi:MAG: aspartyl/glutamyl-tRNA amidotransferase subunit C [Gemmatimonadaceae bacterium]|nr:aspartyl/glutamyl-tRNA amidotransferase subunit C [Gemmatimonadaceae bacterium]